jgi:hypothetical protein
MRYRSFGDRSPSLSAITVRLEATRQKGNAHHWRDFVFAAFEAGVNAFEIGHTDVAMLTGVAEAFAAMDRRLFVVCWRTSLTGGPLGISHRVDDLTAALGLSQVDLLTLELDVPLHHPDVLVSLQETRVARWLAAAGPPDVIDQAIETGHFDGLVMKHDPAGGWADRNRIRAAAAGGMGVMVINTGIEVSIAETVAPAKGGLLGLFKRRPAPPAPSFRVNVPGWTEQQVAVAHALTDPAVSTVMVQPNCIPTLEGLAWAVERDLPAGAQAQIEMSRFSGQPVEFERRSVRRA